MATSVSYVTDFMVKDSNSYLEGFGTEHQTEAFPGANPKVNNTPQNPAYGLRTERISATAFVGTRDHNKHTWLYRAQPTLKHKAYRPVDVPAEAAYPELGVHLSPNPMEWPTLPALKGGSDWTTQRLLASTGDPNAKSGVSIWVFTVTRDMGDQTAYASLDGECLIVPQGGALDLTTEMGRLTVRQGEIAVVPRSVRYRVTLPKGVEGCRGMVFELHEGLYRLPELGIIGSVGLANQRDFEVPVAYFQGTIDDATGLAKADNGPGDWTIVERLSGKLWACAQDHTPFDVAAWHGGCYPYKYDLAKFNFVGSALYDYRDPSLFVVLTAPAFGKAPGTAVIDFCHIRGHWLVGENTAILPYYHRNTMQEFMLPIVATQDPAHPLNQGEAAEFKPWAAALNGNMVGHGPTEEELQAAKDRDTSKPHKLFGGAVSLVLAEFESPMKIGGWAAELAQLNFRGD